VPRIRDEFLDCVLYLYPSHKDADEGISIGGTGFIAVVPTEGLKENFYFPYVVTNRHVIDQGNTVVRMTTRDGKKHIIETDERDWRFHPDGDDLAVLLISFDPAKLRFNHVDSKDFLSKHALMTLGVGIGDDIFVVGRFINHEGRQKNSPTARFGCIAQMPNEPVRVGTFDQECFLVEARSIGGFSGSPVFWHVLPFAGGAYRPQTNIQIGPFLLGVELGYIRDWTSVCDAAGRPINPAKPDAQQVKVNSGMMIVVPAWKLTDLLNEDSIMAKRKEIEGQVKEQETRRAAQHRE
jgi:Trypsin-like peptidase domain